MSTAQAEAPKVVAEKPKSKPILSPTRISELEDANRTHRVVVEHPTKYEEIFDRDYWGNVARRLTQFDKIVATPDDGSWYAELLVTNTDSMSWATVTQALYVRLDEAETSVAPVQIPSGYSVAHKGPHLKFCAIRNKDGAILQKQFKNFAAAADWLVAYGRDLKT